jgi:hypothetical protein
MMKAKFLCMLFVVASGGAGCGAANEPVQTASSCSEAQSGANLFPNGGFDQTSAAWAGEGGWDGTVDAEACSKSGSLRTGKGLKAIGPLLPVEAGVIHHFGYLARREQPLVAVSPCTIYWCKTSPCTIPDEAVGWDEAYTRPTAGGAWEISSGDFLPPPGVTGARVVCGLDQGEDHFDRFYWSPVTAGF